MLHMNVVEHYDTRAVELNNLRSLLVMQSEIYVLSFELLNSSLMHSILKPAKDPKF